MTFWFLSAHSSDSATKAAVRMIRMMPSVSIPAKVEEQQKSRRVHTPGNAA